MNQPVKIGAGSGRCGTQSLAKLVNDCNYVHMTHELDPRLPLKFNLEVYQIHLKRFLSQYNTGNSALHYLHYLERFIKDIGWVKIVVLKRDKQETINSFIKKTDHGNRYYERVEEFGQFVSVNNKMDKKKMFGIYYDAYYREVNRLLKKYPKHIKLFPMDALNNKQNDIFKWYEIPKKDRRYKDNPKYNTIEEHYEYIRNNPDN